MSFPRVKRGARGYNAEQVDAFIAQARVAYDSNIAGAVTLTSTDIRNTAFSLQKGGYSTRHVDGALERLETAFAERERAVALATMGEAAWLQQTSELSAALTSRFARKPGQRFNKAKFLAQGYKIKDVDAFAERVNAFLTTGEPLSVADVRSVTFRPGRGGYDEAQVDAVLDALVELLLALGNN
ncbi:DivIVA domain-containing protein [Aurantimicrobium minutum]|uniref:DivIVA domain-containing protein n=1 Tax=Aurantimicrobium minutum TaxID=708131 RepID=UPI00247620B0|nr:DivIVA domain-containing protein [Aurantimicrobium minutum]MDH6239640.1 DivIVA domain-containing protein [Aurantimicrobium minutum]